MEEIKDKETNGELKYRIGGGRENIEIVEIGVQKKREGGGTRMFRELEKRTRNMACIYCFTRKSNRIARAFYKAMGFKKVCEIPKFYRNEGAVMYIKRNEK